jgi:hypothetical protein
MVCDQHSCRRYLNAAIGRKYCSLGKAFVGRDHEGNRRPASAVYESGTLNRDRELSNQTEAQLASEANLCDALLAYPCSVCKSSVDAADLL